MRGIRPPVAAATRRRFLGIGAGVAAAGMFGLPRAVRADARFAQRVALYNIHTEESVDTMFWDGSRFVPEAVTEIEWLLRDWRTGQVVQMDLRLMLILRSTALRMRVAEPLHVVSGFRSQSTNLMLHRNDPEGVPEQSYHMYGMAIDVRLPGVNTEDLRDAALWAANGNGGVGYYPRSDFVHIDTGRAARIW
jgi:uncharacterized protein YcbK (DUF882 family)